MSKEVFVVEWCRNFGFSPRKARQILRKSNHKKIAGRWIATESIIDFLKGKNK